ncbi:pyridoxamine 5'-phosphate oxidase family protein [Tepidiforma sp.]|uniref:pyridoxamine 5'-phosphate oxidase family protein n=1 Tax=Tepidiforma sp. TaxID=2682230 RepID=UPI002ADD93D9|nr:pyridoxamine 5'-phosphate oxidase family protein [Tepidiforma sp.]
MGTRALLPNEIELVLAKERVVRVAFFAEGEHFVVPLFYTWAGGVLCGLTTPGRKLELARRNPRVAFQVDSTATTGPWEWASVSGWGTWEEVDDPFELAPLAGEFAARLADAPAWAAQALEARFAERGMVGWRLAPAELGGRAHGPEEPAEA